jgi:hypothetical protein
MILLAAEHFTGVAGDESLDVVKAGDRKFIEVSYNGGTQNG